MTIDFSALKTELQTDPNVLGYAAHVDARFGGTGDGSYSSLAGLINATNVSFQYIPLTRVSAQQLLTAVDQTEYEALTDRKAQQWNAILAAASTNGLDGGNAAVRTVVANVWAAGTTRTNLLALAPTRDGSRAEELFDQLVTGKDCIKALRDF